MSCMHISMQAADAESRKKNVFTFTFCDGCTQLGAENSGNAEEWDRLVSYFLGLSDLDASGYYFLIESYIYNNVETSLLPVLNQATYQGNIVRSRLKSTLGIPANNIAFYINRNKNISNRVQVTLVKQPIPVDANHDIYYSLSSSRKEIAQVLSRYAVIPYYDQAYYEEANVVAEQPVVSQAETIVKQEQPVAIEEQPAKVAPQEPAVATATAVHTVQNVPADVVVPALSDHPVAHPFNLAIKTNLIPWMGVVPCWGLGGESSSDYSKGAMMYNGALEYYFAGCASIEASFLYSYTSYGGKSNNLWGISTLTVEPRYWLRADNSFRGLSVGLRLEYGDFDMQNNKPEKYGKTGRFYSAAFSLGYTQPIYRNLLVEGRAFVGYRNVYDGKDYRIDDTDRKNYLEQGFSDGQWVVGVSLSLLFRLGFW